MRKISILLVSFLIYCGDGNPSSQNEKFTLALLFLQNTLQSVPMFSAPADISSYGLVYDYPDNTDQGDTLLFSRLNDLLAFQCHKNASKLKIAFCPENTNELTENQFSLETLTGLITEAFLQIYTYYPDDRKNRDCSSANSKNPIQRDLEFEPSFTQSTHLLDEELWECYEKKSASNNTKVFTLFNRAIDQKTYALTQYRLGDENKDIFRNQLIEFYARRDSSNTETFETIAWNIVFYEDIEEGQDSVTRLTGIMSPKLNRMVVKYSRQSREASSTGLFSDDIDTVLFGVSGFSAETESFTTGRYFAKSRLYNANDQISFDRTYCISNNPANTFYPYNPSTLPNNPCNLFSNSQNLFFDNASGYFSDAGLFTFLDLNNDDTEALQRFVTVLDGPQYLGVGQLLLPNQFPTNIKP